MQKPLEIIGFDNYEDREQNFRQLIFNILPRKYAGVSTFWLDFTSNFHSIAEYEIEMQSFITSTPLDCIAFATPFQTINAAMLTVKGREENTTEILNKFHLIEIQNHPIKTLSGGESVRLALAKAYVFSKIVNQLIISSPFVWLDLESNKLLELLIKEYSRKEKSVKILTLFGEQNENRIATNFELDFINFSLRFNNVVLDLSPILNVDINSKETIAIINNIKLDLISPCLLKGKNGSGKSLISMSLSKVISKTGEATIENNGKIGFARMLFQDVISQTLNRDFNEIIYYSGLNKDEVLTVYDQLINEFKQTFLTDGEKVPIFSYDKDIGYKTIIEIKFILTAIRILDKPSLLILDEPAWGLTKKNSFAFVKSVLVIAHKNQIPIIIITNHNWYDNIIKSSIIVSKNYKDNILHFNLVKK